MSALPPKADMCSAHTYVRFGPIADISRPVVMTEQAFHQNKCPTTVTTFPHAWRSDAPRLFSTSQHPSPVSPIDERGPATPACEWGHACARPVTSIDFRTVGRWPLSRSFHLQRGGGVPGCTFFITGPVKTMSAMGQKPTWMASSLTNATSSPGHLRS